MADEESLKILFQRFLENRCSTTEVEQLMRYFHTNESTFLVGLIEDELSREILSHSDEFNSLFDEAYLTIHSQVQFFNLKARTRRLWLRLSYAASITILLGAGVYFFTDKKPADKITEKQTIIIKPGSEGAILTLSNGKRVILENEKNSFIANGIYKSNSNSLVYDHAQEMGYNTLETPKGKQYSVVLPDGTKVWLNASSSLTYPTLFTGNNRKVKLTGEAYFVVTHNSKMPFQVEAANQLIEDVGTEFNVNAYSDEPYIRTTLTEGKAIVKSDKGNQVILKPGMQAYSSHDNALKVADVETDVVIAWKNGKFKFDNADIQSIMRMVGRWYNVDVVYQGPPPIDKFNGGVSRFSDVTDVLNTLEATDKVHFKIESNRIIVSR